ncbi:MAG: glycosyltransferase, partial [Kiritimatiellae bacterium]|nr:glycosyltransferase [Kiritimatiellia bacterium]
DWVGKNWAVTQGGRVARGDWLFFVDGDVVLHPAAVRRAVEKGLAAGVDVVSVLPSIKPRSIWENLVMPLFALLSAMMKPPDHANRLETSASRLSGAFLLIRREAYAAVGGHEAVRREILEDMAMAESMKRSGRPVCLAYTHDLASTHLYATFREMWEGLTRSGFPMLGYSVGRLAGMYLAAGLGPLVPWFLVGWGAWALATGRADGLLVLLLGAALVEFMAGTVRVVTDHIGLRRRYSYLLPAASTLLCLAAAHSAFRCCTRRGLSWKQRTYR